MKKERRRAKRVNSLIDVKYVSRSGDIGGRSFTQDVSEGGIGIPVDGKIPNGSRLDLSFHLWDKSKRDRHIIPATAAVKWSGRSDRHWMHRYYAGLSFIEIDTDNRKVLIEFAKKHAWQKTDLEKQVEDGKYQVFKKEEGF